MAGPGMRRGQRTRCVFIMGGGQWAVENAMCAAREPHHARRAWRRCVSRGGMWGTKKLETFSGGPMQKHVIDWGE